MCSSSIVFSVRVIVWFVIVWFLPIVLLSNPTRSYESRYISRREDVSPVTTLYRVLHIVRDALDDDPVLAPKFNTQ